ncbi:hypothetical protein BSQ98_19190 [Serratia liquefaciens]|uniref:hypothetical protein n=1 Tax=Serratia TaxID=613 RepID=UPI00101F61F2|nr:hypothetical protein [Serratia liquefaciens]RYM60792.1 hypothetical protein BSQ98_19190 [Serratia liquefaciens]
MKKSTTAVFISLLFIAVSFDSLANDYEDCVSQDVNIKSVEKLKSYNERPNIIATKLVDKCMKLIKPYPFSTTDKKQLEMARKIENEQNKKFRDKQIDVLTALIDALIYGKKGERAH